MAEDTTPTSAHKIDVVGMDTEPARLIGYITAAVASLITLLVVFGVNISDEQRNAILVFMGTLAPIVIFVIEMIRRQVYSPRTVKRIKAAHKAATTRATQ